MLQFCPPNSSEADLLARFKKPNIGAGETFGYDKFSPEIKQAIGDGIKDANADLATVMQGINSDQITSAQMFGYDGKTQLLVANPLKRYLLNSTTLKSYKYGRDGSLTLYISHDSPGAAKQSNWLPAPDGPFYAIFRVYLPGAGVADGTWKKPPMQPVAK